MNVCFEIGPFKNEPRLYGIVGWSDSSRYTTHPPDFGPIGPFSTFAAAEKHLMQVIKVVERETESKAIMTDRIELNGEVH